MKPRVPLFTAHQPHPSEQKRYTITRSSSPLTASGKLLHLGYVQEYFYKFVFALAFSTFTTIFLSKHKQRHWLSSIAQPTMSSHVWSRMRSKRLLKTLKFLQKEDSPVTPFLLIEAKFRFLISRRCICIHVQYEEADAARFNIPPTPLSRFILSQVEAQKLTDKISARDSILPILFLINLSLPTDPSRQPSFPTLFCWHCRPRHRTYCFFAYLTVKMSSNSYTIDELLGFRVQNNPTTPKSLSGSGPELGEYPTASH